MSHSFLRAGHLDGGAASLKGLRLSAGLVWPVSSPPIRNGAVLAGPDGRILSAGSDAAVPTPAGCPRVELGLSVLLPGLVNTHTHLELTGFAGQIHDARFFDWIQRVRRAKAARSAEGFLEDARAGVRQMWAHGVTTVADTGDTGAAAAALRELGGRGVVYQEVFGPHPDQELSSFRNLVDAVRKLAPGSGPVRIGVSPHAPYTVSAPLYRRVAEFARNEGLPLAVHLAESHAETALVTAGAGPFADLWRGRGIPLPVPARSPVAFLDNCGVLGPDTLVIHAVQTDEDDRRRLRDSGCAVALCPRSNDRHGHGYPPVDRYLKLGIRTGVGSDSVASIDAPDLFAEGRVIGKLTEVGADLSAIDVLRMLTLGGAEAIGLEREVGSLEPGKWADLVCVNLPSDDRGEPELTPWRVARGILDQGATGVRSTWVAGRRVYAG